MSEPWSTVSFSLSLDLLPSDILEQDDVTHHGSGQGVLAAAEGFVVLVLQDETDLPCIC